MSGTCARIRIFGILLRVVRQPSHPVWHPDQGIVAVPWRAFQVEPDTGILNAHYRAHLRSPSKSLALPWSVLCFATLPTTFAQTQTPGPPECFSGCCSANARLNPPMDVTSLNVANVAGRRRCERHRRLAQLRWPLPQPCPAADAMVISRRCRAGIARFWINGCAIRWFESSCTSRDKPVLSGPVNRDSSARCTVAFESYLPQPSVCQTQVVDHVSLLRFDEIENLKREI